MLVAYNFGQDPSFTDRLRHAFHWAAIQPDLPRVLKKAKQKDIGVLAMKTLMGARLNDMRPYERRGATFSQAAFRWVLSGGYADALLISMTGKEGIDEYLGASGEAKITQGDLELLERYAQMQTGSVLPERLSRLRGELPRAGADRRGAAHANVRGGLPPARAGADGVRRARHARHRVPDLRPSVVSRRVPARQSRSPSSRATRPRISHEYSLTRG